MIKCTISTDGRFAKLLNLCTQAEGFSDHKSFREMILNHGQESICMFVQLCVTTYRCMLNTRMTLDFLHNLRKQLKIIERGKTVNRNAFVYFYTCLKLF
ncbi:Transposase [Wolbachia endosymbiont of Cylisticus convexus]|nr:Transposase [Wolbachia endosymbiont of Cylisticus convexus]